MSTIPVTYPFDPTGTATTNLVVRDEQILTAVNVRDFQFVVPAYAPFFAAGLIVKHVQTNRILVEGLDYVLGYEFVKASRAVAKPIYGAVVFYDRSLAGVVQLTYQTIGGEWTLSPAAIADILANRTVNPRITAWEEVANQPQRFPPIEHEWDVADMVGMSDVVESLNRMATAIRAGADETALAHFNNYDNPHQTTKAQVGLGNVENLPRADLPTAIAGLSNNFYLTPLTAKALSQSVANSVLLTHSQDHSNPHQTNKSQVGLGLVQNYGTASEVQAEGGTSQDTYMTPFLTKLSIQALLGNTVNAHLLDYDNPHHVNKAQVGLSQVQNLPLAEEQEARDGIVQNKYMTPYLTKLSVQALVTTALNTHVADVLNPHQVTKAQVGLSNVPNYAMATDQAAADGIAQNAFMSPYHVKLAIQQLAAGNIDVHISDLDNPHQVTAAQLGVLTAVQITELLGGYLTTSGSAADALKLGGKTYSEVVAAAASAASTDADTLGGQTLSQLFVAIANSTVDNATHLENLTLAQVKESILTEALSSSLNIKVYPAPGHLNAHWTAVGAIKIPDINSTSHATDKKFMITGVERDNAVSGPLFMARLSIKKDSTLLGPDSQYLEVVNMFPGAAAVDCEFGYVLAELEQQLELWVRSPTPRSDIVVVDLTPNVETGFTSTSTWADEPSSIHYVPVTATGGSGGISEADLNAAIAEFSVEFSTLPSLWAGNVSAAVSADLTGYISAAFTGNTDVGSFTESQAFESGGVMQMVTWKNAVGVPTVNLYIEGTYPDGYVTGVTLNGKLFDTPTEYLVAPFNGHFVYAYSFTGTDLADLPPVGLVAVEIK